MAEYLIAQRFVSSDPWSLLVGGREIFSDPGLDEVISFVRSQPEADLPLVVHVAVRPMAETCERVGLQQTRSIFSGYSLNSWRL
jgi:hypothetical protein